MTRRFIAVLCFVIVGFCFQTSVFAACTNPAGEEAHQFYNTTFDVMQYCNGTNWVNMGAPAGSSADNLGNHTAIQALNMGGFGITGAAGIQVGNSSACAAGNAGTIRYVGGASPWEYCSGSAWLPFKPSQCVNDATGECTLTAVRATSDPQFTAANIASGVNILGVTGTLVVPPNCTNDLTTQCVLNAARSGSDPEFTAANIRQGVNVLGVTGSYAGSGLGGNLTGSAKTVLDCTAALGGVYQSDGNTYCGFESCPSGWSQYSTYTITKPNTCGDSNCTQCTTGSHNYFLQTRETCTARDRPSSRTCGSNYLCYANIFFVACI